MSRAAEEAALETNGAGQAGGPAPVKRESFRVRNRRRRHQEFLDTALQIVVTEGVDALTMQRVTDELQCATGSIYGYFPSKGALMAALQREALLQLGVSLQASQAHLEELLAGAADDVAALTRIVAGCRFWVAAEDTYPQQIVLTRRLFTAPGEVVADDEGAPALSPAVALLAFASDLLDRCVATGALQPGDSFDRAAMIIAGVTGVLLGSSLARWDSRLERSPRIADAMLTDLFLAWGARREMMDAADALVATLAERGHLVPVVAVDQ